MSVQIDPYDDLARFCCVIQYNWGGMCVREGPPEPPSLNESLAGVDFSVGEVLLHTETSVTSKSRLVSGDLRKRNSQC